MIRTLQAAPPVVAPAKRSVVCRPFNFMCESAAGALRGSVFSLFDRRSGRWSEILMALRADRQPRRSVSEEAVLA